MLDSNLNATSPKSLDQNGTLSRKTTTWNVRRNQTTSLGVGPTTPTPSLQQFQQQNMSPSDKIFKTKVSSKDDTSLDLTNVAEPGSPNFTKELLSIR